MDYTNNGSEDRQVTWWLDVLTGKPLAQGG
jgi:hypothetical protein